MVCRYVVAVFGRPRWRKARRAISGSRQALRELLDRLVDAGLVAGGERHQQLLDDVGDLGQAQVVPAQLQHVGLEILDAAQEVVVAPGDPRRQVLQSHWSTPWSTSWSVSRFSPIGPPIGLDRGAAPLRRALPDAAA